MLKVRRENSRYDECGMNECGWLSDCCECECASTFPTGRCREPLPATAAVFTISRWVSHPLSLFLSLFLFIFIFVSLSPPFSHRMTTVREKDDSRFRDNFCRKREKRFRNYYFGESVTILRYNPWRNKTALLETFLKLLIIKNLFFR